MSASDAEFQRIANLPNKQLVSEEDVKNKVILPMFRALGYNDADFNYERRTGRGYADIVGEHFPTGIVMETKAPRTRLDNHIDQLEAYVFQKHARDRATIAILTDGDVFHVFGVTEPLYGGSLGEYRIETFKRSQLADSGFLDRLKTLLSKDQNQAGAITGVITARRRDMKERLQAIDTELQSLILERNRIDTRLQELQSERAIVFDTPVSVVSKVVRVTTTRSGSYHHTASLHILRLLTDRHAISKSGAVERSWLDEQLISKVDGVDNQQMVSWGLIELKAVGKIDYEKRSGKIGRVWLK